MNRLFFQAVLALLTLPGIVAFAVPLLVFRPPSPMRAFTSLGAVVLGFGVGMLLWCVRDFYVIGRGTLAPWAPPQRLVVTGLYRVSRNPMYVGVLTIVAGWALGFRSLPLGWYTVALMVVFHLRVVLAEEPYLARAYGAAWSNYATRVPRWVGRSRTPAGAVTEGR